MTARKDPLAWDEKTVTLVVHGILMGCNLMPGENSAGQSGIDQLEAIADTDTTTQVRRKLTPYQGLGIKVPEKLQEFAEHGWQHEAVTLVDPSEFGFYILQGKPKSYAQNAKETVFGAIEMNTGGLVNLGDDGGIEDLLPAALEYGVKAFLG